MPPAIVALAPFAFPLMSGPTNGSSSGSESRARSGASSRSTSYSRRRRPIVWRLVRGEQPRPRPVGGRFGRRVVALISLCSCVDDSAASTNRLAFFVLPFAVLLAVVAHSPFRPWLTRVLAIEAHVLGCLFAGGRHRRGLDAQAPVRQAEARGRRAATRATSASRRSSPTLHLRAPPRHRADGPRGRGDARASQCPRRGPHRVHLGRALLLYRSRAWSRSPPRPSSSRPRGGRRTRRLMARRRRGSRDPRGGRVCHARAYHSVNRVVSGRWTLVQDTWVVFGNHPLEGVGVASQPAARCGDVWCAAWSCPPVLVAARRRL